LKETRRREPRWRILLKLDSFIDHMMIMCSRRRWWRTRREHVATAKQKSAGLTTN
jgi:hypothetical protein